MRRVMIIGQPGSGKSTLARAIGAKTGLPVVHIDRIHWQDGWVERSPEEKTRLCRAVEETDAWIFEGGHSATWATRLARADLLVWLDRPVWLRSWRVARRTLRHLGPTRPDLPDGCPEVLGQQTWDFFRFIWRTRRSARDRMAQLAAGAACPVVTLRSDTDVAEFLARLPTEDGRPCR
jgi:adenylate kinase family enzyme